MPNPWDSIPVYNGPVGVTSTWSREAAGSTDNDLWAFRRLTGENRPDELDETTYNRYQRLAAWLYYQNPLARRMCDISTEFVLGAGVQIDADKAAIGDASADQVKSLVKRFLAHPANEFALRLPGYFTTVNMVNGELFLPAFVHPSNGDLALGYLEHHLVQSVVFDPNNRMQAVAVIQRPAKPGEKAFWWNVIRAEQGQDDPVFPQHPAMQGDAERREIRQDIGPMVGAIGKTPEDFVYAGELFYFRTNVLGTGRGRSSLEPCLDWLHAYDNFLFGDLRNANLQAAFVWDVEVTGADQTTLNQKAQLIKQNPPRPGEVNVHNEKEKWSALSPNLNAASHTELGVQVKKVIGLSVGLPSHLIGAENNTNRTTSSSSDIPFVRRMEQRQRLLSHIVETILDYQLDQKVHAGLLKDAKRPYPYRVVLPSLTAGESLAQAERLYNITMGLVEAVKNGITCAEEAQRIFYAYGLDEQDMPDDLMAKVKKDREDGLVLDPVKQAEDALKAKTAAPEGGEEGPGRVKRAKSQMGAPGSGQRGK